MADLTHHPQCSSVGGDACDCLGRVIPTERPLDLARCRALASDAGDRLDAIASLLLEMQSAMRRGEPVHANDLGDDPATIKRLATDLTTALRAACDEVERLREQRERLRSHLAFPRRALQEQHEATDSLKAELAEARALLTAARAEGATAERARLAGMASEEDREMVEALMEAVRDEMESHYDPHEERTTLLAAFAAQRERVVGECVKVVDGYSLPFPDAVHNGERQNEIVADMCADLRALLAAPTKGEGG